MPRNLIRTQNRYIYTYLKKLCCMTLIIKRIYGYWYRELNRGMEGNVRVRDLPNVSETVQFMDDNTILLVKHHITIGRHTQSNIIIDSTNVSRHHCFISKHTLGHWFIRDLNSTNGTFLKRGNSIIPLKELGQDVNLKQGDIICLSDFMDTNSLTSPHHN